jgi:hypothetical protein
MNKFNLGDRVVNKRMGISRSGTVKSSLPGANGQLFIVLLDDGSGEKTFYEVELEFYNPTFTIGDKVLMVGSGLNGTIVNYGAYAGTYDVLPVARNTTQLVEAKFLYPFSISGVTNVSAGWHSYTPPVVTPPPPPPSNYQIPVGKYEVTVNTYSTSNGIWQRNEDKFYSSDQCRHELKEYFGLNEKFKYCTKCSHKESV